MIYDFFCEFFERYRVMGLFDGIDGITLSQQVLHGVYGILIILPSDTFFRSEGRFVYLLIRRAAAYTAEQDTLDTHGIGRTEDSADIMLAPHIIEDHDERQFIRFSVLVDIHATHLGCCQFAVHKAKGKWT